MASTLRLSPFIQERVAAYAEKIGISVTALVTVALVDYLDSREPEGASAVGDGRASDQPPVVADRVQAALVPPDTAKPATDVLAGPNRKQKRHLLKAASYKRPR